VIFGGSNLRYPVTECKYQTNALIDIFILCSIQGSSPQDITHGYHKVTTLEIPTEQDISDVFAQPQRCWYIGSTTKCGRKGKLMDRGQQGNDTDQVVINVCRSSVKCLFKTALSWVIMQRVLLISC